MIGYDSIDYASLTDVGMRRSHNQDAHASLLATDQDQWHERGHVFLVADGMGAHAVGELASEMAVNIIPHTYHKHASQTGVDALRKAFAEANATIHSKGQQNPDFGGMGTTSTAILLRPEGAWIGHVGDSRAYRVRDGHIEQLSFDHSLVWMIAKRDNVDPDTLTEIPSNVIVRSLGPEPFVRVDLEGPHPIQAGDFYVLCSDGLSGQVSDTEIGAIVTLLPPAEACHFLVDLANYRGGPDNITVIIVRVRDDAEMKENKPVDAVPILKRLPWPLTTLFVGVVLAAGAMYLAMQGMREIGLPLFLLAAMAIIAGLIGLVMHYRKEQDQLAREPNASRPQIHRRRECNVDAALAEKVVKAIEGLRQQIAQKPWEVDEQSFRQHLGKAKELQGQAKIIDSCREYCRAMRVLLETLARYRARDESFQPVWDKS